MSQQVWHWDPGIQLVDISLCLMMNKLMAKSDLVHSSIDTWEFVEAFIVWRGRLSLLLHMFGVTFGWVGFGIMEMLRHDVFDICQYFTIGLQERRI